ncbi:MAG: DUF6152 family protein [Croceibacterium sp.]
MNRPFFVLAGAAAMVASAPAAAHHSAAMFDFRNPVTAKGTVKMIEVINPHSHIVMAITDKKGTRDWTFEGHSASNFYRAGFNRGAVKPGDVIKITYAPMRDGTDGGYVVAFTTAKGDKVGFDPPG